MKKKRILFYLVHPAKFHFHKLQIQLLKEKGHHVDIFINTKDILEELLINEGWHYVNLFPNSRKIKGIHVYIAAFLSLISTIFKLFKHTWGKKYDLFIGDALVYVGFLRGIPSFYPTDDVLAAVPEQRVFFIPAKHIIAPLVTDIGKYKSKKISYNGYKALAHLHPNHFQPNRKKLVDRFLNAKKYFIIRCTGFGATHDLNKKGIDDQMLLRIVEILKPYGEVLISAERKIPKELQFLQTEINKNDIAHYIAHCNLFIGDSTTMCTESAILGIPTIEFDEYFYEIEQMVELEEKYNLIRCFRTHQIDECLEAIKHSVQDPNSLEIHKMKTKMILNDMIDVSSFLTWFFENYPQSFKEYQENPSIQDKFK